MSYSAAMRQSNLEAATTPLEEIEARLLIDGIYSHYGFDFRNYSGVSIRRRLNMRRIAEDLPTLSALQEKVLHDRECMERLLLDLSIQVTAMFRDPAFYCSFRERVVPLLRTYPFIRIWHAGCSTGEEVYSMAILMQEEGLYDRTRIYATDMSDLAVLQARKGIFPLESMKEYTANYIQAGGRASFSNYYTARYDNAILRADLRRNTVFSSHNLATDGVFNEFNVIVCRNVIIYFNPALRNRAVKLFHDSLCRFGFLCLGTEEFLNEENFDPIDTEQKVYRRAH